MRPRVRDHVGESQSVLHIRRITVKKRDVKAVCVRLLFFVEMLAVVQPAFLNRLSIQAMHAILLLACGAELLAFIGRAGRGEKILPYSLTIVLFVMIQWIITLVCGSQSLVASMKYPISVLLLFFALTGRLEKDPKETIHDLALFFWWLIFANFLSMLLFPKGLFYSQSVSQNNHTNFFLGVDNQFGKIFFPGFALIWFDREVSEKRSAGLTVTALLMMAYCYLRRLNGTGIVCMAVLLFLFFVYYLSRRSWLLSWKTHFCAITLFVASIIVQTQEAIRSNPVFSFFFTLLGKQSDFSGRLRIWEQCMISFRNHILFGIGQQGQDVAVYVSDRPYAAHNILFQILVESGLIGILALLLVVCLPLIGSSRIRSAYTQVTILYTGVFVTFVYYMMETTSLIPLMAVLLVLAYYNRQPFGQSAEVQPLRCSA